MPRDLIVDGSKMGDRPKLKGLKAKRRSEGETPKPLKPKRILAMVMTVEEAADHVGVSSPTIRRMCLDGRLKCRKAKGTWLIYAPDAVVVHGKLRSVASA